MDGKYMCKFCGGEITMTKQIEQTGDWFLTLEIKVKEHIGCESCGFEIHNDKYIEDKHGNRHELKEESEGL